MTANGFSPSRPQVHIDGRVDGCVDAADRGLAYGDGLFETCRVQAGRVALLELHFARLFLDLEKIGFSFENNEIKSKVKVGLDAIHKASGTFKIIVTRGSGGRGYAPPEEQQCRVITLFYADEANPFAHVATPAKLWLCQTRLALNPALAGLKHLARLENVLARAEFSADQYHEGLLLDTADSVVECTAHNLFAVVENTLVTPPLDGAGVAGVMRQLVMERLAPRLNLRVREAPLSLEQLAAAAEVFICNSNRGLRPVASLTGKHKPVAEWGESRCAQALQRQLQTCIAESVNGEL